MHDVIRKETENRDGQDCIDDPPCPTGGAVVNSGDSACHDGVTHQYDRRGKERSKNETYGAVGRQDLPLF